MTRIVQTSEELSAWLTELFADLRGVAVSHASQREREAAVERLIAEYELPDRVEVEVRPRPTLTVLSRPDGPGARENETAPP